MRVRGILAWLLCATVLIAAPARAQVVGDPVQLYMIQLLASPDAALRRRAMREVETAAPTLAPPTLYAVASQLADAREYEAAVLWGYFAELRFRTDLALTGAPMAALGLGAEAMADMFAEAMQTRLPARVHHISPERRRALFAMAARMEERTARSYPPDWMTGISPGPPTGETPSWPARREIASAVRRSRDTMRARLEEGFRLEGLESEISLAIAAGETPAEAARLIPPSLEGRMRPRGAVSLLDNGCADVMGILATPSRASEGAFVVHCRALETGESRFVWLASADGRILGAAAQPQDTAPTNAMAVRAGASYIVFARSNQDIVLVAADGGIEHIVPPPVAGIPYRHLTGVTRSGRYAIFGGGDVNGVLDLESNQWIWTRPSASVRPEQRPAPGVNFVYVEEDATGSPYLVATRRSDCGAEGCAEALQTLDILSQRERTLELGGLLSVTRHSRREAMAAFRPIPVQSESAVRAYANEEEWREAIAAESGARASAATRVESAVIDLELMTVAWRGPRDEAPAGREPKCAIAPRNPFNGSALGDAEGSEVTIDGRPLPLPRSERARPDACAISADGASMAISASPFVYVYDLSSQR